MRVEVLKAGAQLVSAACTALFLILDIRGFDTTADVGWRYWALGSFAVFLIIVYYRDVERLLNVKPYIVVEEGLVLDFEEHTCELIATVRNEAKQRVWSAVASNVFARVGYSNDYTEFAWYEAWWAITGSEEESVLNALRQKTATLDPNGAPHRVLLAWHAPHEESIFYGVPDFAGVSYPCLLVQLGSIFG